MRAYFFGNMYLSSIQQGIQAGHVIHELFTKYSPEEWTASGSPSQHLYDWAENHKTMILLNAGYADNIRSLIEQFDKSENPYPWEFFKEGQDSLDGALTCVGIVLPEKIYETAAYLRRVTYRNKKDILESIQELGEVSIPIVDGFVKYELSKWEFALVQEIGNYGMAS